MSSDLENDEIIILNPIAKAINNPFSENISSTKANQVIGSIEDEYKARNDADIEINHVTTPEKKNSLCWLILLFVTNRVFLSCIFTSIAMIVGIIVVYYTIPQPPIKTCVLKFERKTKTDMQYNSRSRAIAVGDFNDDRYLDLAVVNYGADNIGILLGKGDGTFENQITYSTTKRSLPYAVTIADFNNDTYLDIAVANYGINSVGILLGEGDGSFASPIIFSTDSSRPIAITNGDFNNDSKIDLAVVNHGTNDIGIFLGNGDGTFQSLLKYSTGYDSEPKSLTVADLNKDGYLDIAIANFGTNNIGIFYGIGDGSFTNLNIYSTGFGSRPYSITINDFNGDNHLDIVVANSAMNNIGIFLANNNETFFNQMTFSTGTNSNPHSLIVADFNNDHLQDIAVANTGTDNIGLFFGLGNGSFTDQVTYTTGVNTGVQFVTIGDFNNDSRMDIVVANNATNNVGIFLGVRTADFREQVSYITDNGPYTLAIGDLNNDGQPDTVVGNYYANNIGIFLGQENGSFTDQITISTGSGSYPNYIAIGDLNNDRNLDIVVTNYGKHNIGIFFGYGNGSFADQITYSTGSRSYPYVAIVGDFNNDTLLDIVVCNSYSYTIVIFLNYDNGSFKSSKTYSTGSNPISLAIGDFNNDMKLDIVVANYYSDDISVYLGYGNGTFTEQTRISTGEISYPTFVAVGDYNKDSRLDIITANNERSTTGLLLGNGDGTFQDRNVKWVGQSSYPMCVFVGDFDNDNNLDIAIANYGSKGLFILLGTGSSSFVDGPLYSTGAGGPYFVAADDFNRDGRLDIIVANPDTNTIGMFIGYDSGKFNRITEFSTSYGSLPSSLTVGDFNDDNQSDIGVSNYGSNNFGVFFGNGSGIFTIDKTYFTDFQSQPIMILSNDFNNDEILDLATVNVGTSGIGIFLGYENGSFTNQRFFSTGSGSKPQSLAVGDFNNDNRSDLVVANYGTDNIGVLLGFNLLSFTSIFNYPRTGTNTYKNIATGDMNLDNLTDIIVANYYGPNVQVFFGYGNGSFSDPVICSTGSNSYPTAVAIADFNNDNYLDIVVANYYGYTIGIFLGYGNRSFDKQMTYSTNSGSYPAFVAIGDFNNDNQSDIAVANSYGNNIGIFLGYGNGTFANQITYSTNSGSGPTCLAVSDFNNDNQTDIVVANYYGDTIGIFLGYGNGTFTNQTTYYVSQGIRPSFVAVGDFDKDNNMDIVVSYYSTGYFGIYLGYGNGTFRSPKLTHGGSSTDYLSITVGDFNLDTRLDFAITNRYNNFVALWLGYGNGDFSSPTRIYHSLFFDPSFVHAADFNNDGQLDITIFDNFRVYTFLGTSTKAFLDVMPLSTGIGSLPHSVNVADFNGDGLTDIVVGNSGYNNIGIFFGLGYGFFSNQTTFSTGNRSMPYSIAVGDFNQDDQTDIAVAHYGTGNIGILLNIGNGSFGSIITYLTDPRFVPYFIVTGDINNDQQLDIITANYGSNSIILLFGIGDGTFVNQTEVLMGYDARPVYVALEDINNDKWLDILVTNYGTGNIDIISKTC